MRLSSGPKVGLQKSAGGESGLLGLFRMGRKINRHSLASTAKPRRYTRYTPGINPCLQKSSIGETGLLGLFVYRPCTQCRTEFCMRETSQYSRSSPLQSGSTWFQSRSTKVVNQRNWSTRSFCVPIFVRSSVRLVHFLFLLSRPEFSSVQPVVWTDSCWHGHATFSRSS